MGTFKTFSLLFFALVLVSSAFAQPYYTISGTLSGANEVLPVMSAATGTVSGTYDQATKMITLNVPFSGLAATATASHIHLAGIGMNGQVIVTLTVPAATSGTIMGSYLLPAVNEAAFLAGGTYLNIHNGNFPGGEIRAQLSLAPVAPIPTLSQWGFVTLSISLLIVGVVAVRRKVWQTA